MVSVLTPEDSPQIVLAVVRGVMLAPLARGCDAQIQAGLVLVPSVRPLAAERPLACQHLSALPRGRRGLGWFHAAAC